LIQLTLNVFCAFFHQTKIEKKDERKRKIKRKRKKRKQRKENKQVGLESSTDRTKRWKESEGETKARLCKSIEDEV
jgi:hypothetical protein